MCALLRCSHRKHLLDATRADIAAAAAKYLSVSADQIVATVIGGEEEASQRAAEGGWEMVDVSTLAQSAE